MFAVVERQILLHAIELAGVYDLPVAVWVELEVFGTTATTGIGGFPFEVRLPNRMVLEGSEVLTPPPLPGVRSDDQMLSGRPWAMNYMAEPTAPSMALCRAGVVCQVNEENASRSRFDDKAALSYRVHDALVQRIEAWFDRVRSWVEVVTGQDLDFKFPVADAKDPAEGLLVLRDGKLQTSGHGRFTTRQVRPLALNEWTFILSQVSEDVEPPVEYLLMRDAQAALLRGLLRRAVLDAATATEIVLTQTLGHEAQAKPHGEREKYMKKHGMLKPSIAELERLGVRLEQSWADLRAIADQRNKAIHEGREPDHLEAVVAVSTAARLVSQRGSLSGP